MTDHNWEKTPDVAARLRPRSTQRRIYMFAGLGLIAVVAFLLLTRTSNYYITIEELMTDPELENKSVRVTGAVVGDYEVLETGEIQFYVTHIPREDDEIRAAGGWQKMVVDAANNPDDSLMMTVVYEGEVPELLQHEAQAIMTGRLQDDGVFYADSLQLKCPTRQSDKQMESLSG